MNKNEAIHSERKEHWRGLINQCDASGMTQKDWCQEKHVCMASLSRWRMTIWREEEAEKEFAAAREERAFVEVTEKLSDEDEMTTEVVSAAKPRTIQNSLWTRAGRASQGEPILMKPDAVIGYREYMVGVYEHTSSQVLQRVMEVLRNA